MQNFTKYLGWSIKKLAEKTYLFVTYFDVCINFFISKICVILLMAKQSQPFVFKKLFVTMVAITISVTVSTSIAHAQTVSSQCTNTGPYVDLRGCDLSNANLAGANLFHANLSHAILTNANLANADLSNADLSDAGLFYANLYGANLSGANLSGATVTNANLGGAITTGMTPSTLSGCFNNPVCT